MPEEQIEVVFRRTGNSWIDAGIVGLYRVCVGLPSYVKSDVPDADKKICGEMFPDTNIVLEFDRLVLSGKESSIKKCIDVAYQRLLDCYYNLSTQKQIADTKAYNFYFDSKANKFILFPKRKSWGAAALLFGKALTPKYKERQIPWEKDDKGKKVAGQIAVNDLVEMQNAPERNLKELAKFIKNTKCSSVERKAILQAIKNCTTRRNEEKMGDTKLLSPAREQVVAKIKQEVSHRKKIQTLLNQFLDETKLKAGPGSGLLVDGPNQVRPKPPEKIKFSGQSETACFLTGERLLGLDEGKQTAFPLFGGSRAFTSGTKDQIDIGWKIDFVGKFVPAVSFFSQQGDDLFIFFPDAMSLTALNQTATHIQGMRELHPNLYSNFEIKLGHFFSKPSEITFAFLHQVFQTLSHQQPTTAQPKDESSERLIFDEIAPEKEPVPPIEFTSILEKFTLRGNVAFSTVATSKQGSDWLTGNYEPFTDVLYLARLLARLEKLEERPDGSWKPYCSLKSLFNVLVDFGDQESNAPINFKNVCTLSRNRFCEQVLNRESVLALVEKHAFHINKHADPTKLRRIDAMLKFVQLYEVERYGDNQMEKERYQKLVETATWLGKNIAKSIATKVKSEKGESENRAKGAIHRLRKTRDVARFMDEIARLQHRYGIQVPQDVFNPETISESDFETFRGFCVVAALDRFIYELKSKSPETKTA